MRTLSDFLSHARGLNVLNLSTENPSEGLTTLYESVLSITTLASASTGKHGTLLYECSSNSRTCNPCYTFARSGIFSSSNMLETSSNDGIAITLRIVLDTPESMGSIKTSKKKVLERNVIFNDLVTIDESLLNTIETLPFNTFLFLTENGYYIQKESLLLINTYSSNTAFIAQYKKDGGDTIIEGNEDGEDDDVDPDRDTDDEDEMNAQEAALQIEKEKVRSLQNSIQTAFQKNEDTSNIDSVLYASKKKQLAELLYRVTEAEAAANDEELSEHVEWEALRMNEDLEVNMDRCSGYIRRIKESEEELNAVLHDMSESSFLFEVRQLKLLSELQTIYPIEIIPADPYETNSSNSHVNQDRFAIRGLELLPLDNTRDEEHLSTCLGYIAHVVLLISKYFEISLRYQPIYFSSRSMMRDPSAKSLQSQNLPLYKKDADVIQFRRAVSWLEADIEQLCIINKAPFEKGQNMLYNLRVLFVHMMKADPTVH
jgi:hypothetical protein